MAGVLAALNEQYLVAQYHYRFAKNPTVQLASAGPRSSSTNSGPSKTNTYAAPNPERGPYLLLPSIGVEAPIVFEPSYAEWKVQLALREGVDHYGTTANPGQPGNMVILGHSSGVAWAPGKYKFVFTMLDKLKQNQPIYVDYHGTRYTYKVTEMFVVPPTDGTVLQPTTTPTLTLITCTPVGTSKNRLIVKAELVSPLPAGGTTGAGTSTNGQTQNDMLPAQLPAS
jgi:sortase A